MRYQGGKSRIARPLAQIITLVAGGADCFVSLFCGSCAVESKVQGFSRKILNDRFGLVNVVAELNGEQYILKDIFLRMLKAEPELKLMQGFPADYIITHDSEGKPYPIKEQVARIGNSVVPIMAKVLVQTNCPYLIREELSA